MTSQYSKIMSCMNDNFCVNNTYGLKRGEELFGFVEISIVLKTLENLRQNQVTKQ